MLNTVMDPGQGIADLVQQAFHGLSQSQPDVYQKHVDDATTAYQGLLGQQGHADPLKPKPLIRNKQEALIAALAMIAGNVLDSHHSAGTQGLNAFLGARGESSARDMALQQQNQQLQQQQLQGKIQSAQVGLQGAQQAQQQNDQDKRYAQQQANTDRTFQQNEVYKQQTTLGNLSSKYNAAKTAGAKKAARDLWRNYETQNSLPVTAPDDETLAADVNETNIRNNHLASQDWQAAYKPRLNFFGEIDDKSAAELNGSTKLAIAKSYGIDPATLPDAPTGKTLKSQLFEEKKTEYGEKLKFAKQQETNKLAHWKSEKELAEKRMNVALAHFQENREDRFALAQYQSQLRNYNSANKAANNTAEDAIKKLVPKRDGLKMALQNTDDEKTRAKLQTQLDEVQGQIGSWRSTQEPSITGGDNPGADMGSVVGSGLSPNTPNPNYKPPTGQGTLPAPPKLRQAQGNGFAPFNPLQGAITPTGSRATPSNNPVIRPPDQLRQQAMNAINASHGDPSRIQAIKARYKQKTGQDL